MQYQQHIQYRKLEKFADVEHILMNKHNILFEQKEFLTGLQATCVWVWCYQSVCL